MKKLVRDNITIAVVFRFKGNRLKLTNENVVYLFKNQNSDAGAM